jgi:hypothetical protein
VKVKVNPTPTTTWTHPPKTHWRHPEPAPTVSWLRVSRDWGEPGDTVWLNVACTDDLGPVRSPALDIAPLRPADDGHQPWNLSAPATVRGEPGPGDYRVTAPCGDDLLSITFTVLPEPPPPANAPANVEVPAAPQQAPPPVQQAPPQAPAAGPQQVPRVPRGPVDTGGGATALGQ